MVVPRYGLIGGGERLVRELTERLAADPRWQVHVFANRWLAGTDAIAFHRVPILLFPRFLKPLSFALFARKKIDRVGIDLIHAHERILNAHVYSVHGIPHPIWVKEIRGKGLFIGVELHVPARRFCEALQDRGILCKETHENVIRFAPPLIIGREEIDWAMSQIEPVLMMD